MAFFSQYFTMRWWLFVGAFILLYQVTNAKPVKPKQRAKSPELIREKREDIEDMEEDEGSNEMQKFVLDLSAKEDLRRLRERFKKVKTRDLESDDEYRRLKRFSIHDEHEDHDESMSGRVTMERRSSRTTREDEDVTGPEASLPLKTSQQSSSVEQKSTHPAKDKRSSSFLAQVVSKWKSNIKDTTPARAGSSKRELTPESAESEDQKEDDDTTKENDDTTNGSDDATNESEDTTNESDTMKKSDDTTNESDDTTNESDDTTNESDDTAKESDETENSEIFEDKSVKGYEEAENDPDGEIENTDNSDSGDETAADSIAGSHVNYHLAGESWDIVHHHDRRSLTGSLPSLSTSATTIHTLRSTTANTLANTTKHSEYLQDDVVYDVDQYKRVEKSRRKPRLSKIRVVRSIEPEYEIQEISAVYNGVTDSPDEHSAHVISLSERPIKRDGYIGCFVDQHPNRDLTKAFSVNDLTPDSCRTVCKDKGHTYAGVQYGYLCHCGDDYGKYGNAAEEECDSACQGDEGRKCGGFWRNSVYAADIFGKDENEIEEDEERQSRSHIDRIIPISESEAMEAAPVREEITAYLKSAVPERRVKIETKQAATQMKSTVQYSPNTVEFGSKRADISWPTSQLPRPVHKKKVAYLHPQNIRRSFIPSSIVLKSFNPKPRRIIYTGRVKLKQNWHDNLKDKNSPKTLILAGNIEKALGQMFATDHDFEKAEVLALREALIRNDPSTVHKVLVQFSLTFKKGNRKDVKLREMVENSGRLDDMPVFGNTIDVQEYKDDKQNDQSKDSERLDQKAPKETREAPAETQFEEDKKRTSLDGQTVLMSPSRVKQPSIVATDGVDPFLEKVFSQIRK